MAKKKSFDWAAFETDMRRINAIHAVRMLANKVRDLERGENIEFWKCTQDTEHYERHLTDELNDLLPHRAAN